MQKTLYSGAYQCNLIITLPNYLLIVGVSILTESRRSIRRPRECTTLRTFRFSLNVTAQWSTIFKHALQICFICLGFSVCKTSCMIRPKNLILLFLHAIVVVNWALHSSYNLFGSVTLPNFTRKFDTKRKMLLILSQPREFVYTLSDVKNVKLVQHEQMNWQYRYTFSDRNCSAIRGNTTEIVSWVTSGEPENCECTILYITSPWFCVCVWVGGAA